MYVSSHCPQATSSMLSASYLSFHRGFGENPSSRACQEDGQAAVNGPGLDSVEDGDQTCDIRASEHG